MSIFKCKMCGGTIEFEPGASVGVCDSCGTKQTLPRLDDDRRANLYDRANHFRRNNEFDKAAGIYEQILNEDASDAEAYWSLVLCRYGIEYVEDPATRRRVPTVNRAQYTSIFDDTNYQSALRCADGYQRAIYEQEAAAINEIQKGILAISQKEEPFDVFICYKETDQNGRRTQDSVLANDLYHQLTQEGFKVFFSRITLEDKLGTAYEPYIFAALNSARVMVVLGTKPEYFNAVWVKNEWSRYLSLVEQNGGKKVLIPAYRDMDPYDLPEEFSHLQAQDMSKLGFMQDLIRGIKKLAQTDEPKPAARETVVFNQTANTSAAPLLKRAFMFLEDGDWEKADSFCEQVLNLDPENARAYLGKLMAELRVHRQEDLANCQQPFDASGNFQKAVRFGDKQLSSTLNGYITHIKERNETARLTAIYNDAVNAMNAANSEESYKAAAGTFRTIPGFKDANSLAEQCLEKAEICRKDELYSRAVGEMNLAVSWGEYKSAAAAFKKVPGFKDADLLAGQCHEKAEICRKNAEQYHIKTTIAAKKRKCFLAAIVTACIVFIVILTTVIIPNSKYNAAMALYNAGKYDEAIVVFKELDGYKDSNAQIERCIDSYYIRKWGENNYKKIKNAEAGKTIRFGSYEQDNNTSNGKEEIEWIVLKKSETSLFLISKYALDCQQYNTTHYTKPIIWRTCSLREWLNENFVSNAFNSDEQAMIQITNASRDKVFLLSLAEANEYFSSDNARQCQATAYSKAQGAYTDRSNDNCWWWLLDLDTDLDPNSPYVNVVCRDGSCDTMIASNGYGAVRPAMWISLEP